jgi:flagellar basal-body rod modification protein FlgD
MTPTPEARAAVAKQLMETAAARAGVPTVASTTSGVAGDTAARSTRAEGTDSASDTGNDTPVVPQKELGKDAFLQLLVLQMKSQDPLNPMDNTDMVAQLAQFSALEAQTNLNKSFETLSGNVDQLNFISGAQMLGKTVSGVDVDGKLLTGVVDSVHLDGSLVMLNVGGKLMSMANVFSVKGTPAEGAAT